MGRKVIPEPEASIITMLAHALVDAPSEFLIRAFAAFGDVDPENLRHSSNQLLTSNDPARRQVGRALAYALDVKKGKAK